MTDGNGGRVSSAGRGASPTEREIRAPGEEAIAFAIAHEMAHHDLGHTRIYQEMLAQARFVPGSLTATLFLRLGQRWLNSPEQERAEATFLWLRGGERFARKQIGEEGLRQILRLVRVVAVPSDESVNRIPVSAAEPFQGSVGLRRRAGACRQHDAPVRRGKYGRTRNRWWRVLIG